ncbi:MAG: hypothetical protein IPL79_19960 [Myxococcales bacterium]|nr:hypothetical protein [Myxococcales bacterium]
MNLLEQYESCSPIRRKQLKAAFAELNSGHCDVAWEEGDTETHSGRGWRATKSISGHLRETVKQVARLYGSRYEYVTLDYRSPAREWAGTCERGSSGGWGSQSTTRFCCNVADLLTIARHVLGAGEQYDGIEGALLGSIEAHARRVYEANMSAAKRAKQDAKARVKYARAVVREGATRSKAIAKAGADKRVADMERRRQQRAERKAVTQCVADILSGKAGGDTLEARLTALNSIPTPWGGPISTRQIHDAKGKLLRRAARAGDHKALLLIAYGAQYHRPSLHSSSRHWHYLKGIAPLAGIRAEETGLFTEGSQESASNIAKLRHNRKLAMKGLGDMRRLVAACEFGWNAAMVKYNINTPLRAYAVAQDVLLGRAGKVPEQTMDYARSIVRLVG